MGDLRDRARAPTRRERRRHRARRAPRDSGIAPRNETTSRRPPGAAIDWLIGSMSGPPTGVFADPDPARAGRTAAVRGQPAESLEILLQMRHDPARAPSPAVDRWIRAVDHVVPPGHRPHRRRANAARIAAVPRRSGEHRGDAGARRRRTGRRRTPRVHAARRDAPPSPDRVAPSGAHRRRAADTSRASNIISGAHSASGAASDSSARSSISPRTSCIGCRCCARVRTKPTTWSGCA